MRNNIPTADAGPVYTAALLIIGNEILSGRTQDKNVQFLAQNLNERGIRLQEVRVVPDIHPRVVTAVKDLSYCYSYVFTTGGIGPTHDDITAECMATAFQAPLRQDEGAMAMLRAHYDPRGEQITPARAKMALIPQGARLIPNNVSGAPGFILGNVYVMAGVPRIMQAMFAAIAQELKGGPVLQSVTIEIAIPESRIAIPLATLQAEFSDVDMGSYPSMEEGGWRTTLVLRGVDEARLHAAAEKLRAILEKTVQA